MIRHAGKADRAEEDRIVLADLVEAAFRHHAAVFGVMLAAPVEMIACEGKAEPLAGGFQNANALGQHFVADAVAGNGGDPVLLHAVSPREFSDR